MKFDDTLATVLEQTLQADAVPALMGEPGIGKSSAVKSLATKLATTAFTLPCNQLAAKEDLTGARLVPYTKADGTEGYKQVFYPHQVIQDAVDHAIAHPGQNPILFLDEINRTTSDVTSGILTMVTERRMGDVVLPANLRIVVAGNDKGNVTTLDEASLTRFVIFHVQPDAPTLLEVLGDQVNEWVRKVLTKQPGLVFQKATPNAILVDGPDIDDDADSNVTMADLYDGAEEMSQLTTPRTIDNVSRWLNIVTRDELTQYLSIPTQVGDRETTKLNEILEGFTGQTMFTTQLVGVIAEDLAAGSAVSTPSLSVPKPSYFHEFDDAATINDISELVEHLTPSQRADSLLYALKDTTDQRIVIPILARELTVMEDSHKRTLIAMAQAQMFNDANLRAFLDSGAPMATALGGALTAFI